jgi:CHAT domain-containing protein
VSDAERFEQATCPDADELALFVEGGLRRPERVRLVKHLAECEICRETVAGAAAVLEPAPAKRGVLINVARFRRTGPMVAAGLALAASLVIAVGLLDLWPSTRSTSYDDLIAAVGPNRVVDGRLSGFQYGQATAATRGGSASTLSRNWEVLAAAARIRSVAEAEPVAANLHALGVAHLVLGEYDDAVRNLEIAVSRREADARTHSDLAVAYATRAVRLERAGDWARSLSEAERALKADPNLAEAYFNRAVALDALSLAGQARAAWKEYLALDPQGPWAAEARARLERRSSRVVPFPSVQPSLEAALAGGETSAIARIVDTYPLATSEYFLDELLDRWSARVRVNEDAATEFASIRRLADAIGRRGRDRAASVVVARIESASGARDRLLRLAELHHTFAEGRRLQRADRTSDASAVFDRCSGENAGRHPVALECVFRATSASLNSGGRTASRATLVALARAAESESYLDLLGRIRWRLALFDALDSDFTGALGSYRLALDAFVAAGATEHTSNVHSLISEILRMIGDVDGAWRQHVSALEASRDLWSPSIRHQILVQSVLTSLEADMPEVGLHFADALIEADRAWQHQPSLALALAHRARALTQLGRQTEALEALDEARRTVAGVPDADYQRRFETEVLSARVAVFGANRPSEALAAAEEGLANVRYTRAVPREPGFLFARANAEAWLGKLDEAERDYVAALSALEAERDRLSPDTLRISHLERTFAQVRALVEFELTQRHDPMRALAALEQSRARWLLAAVKGVHARPASPEALLKAIDADTAVVYYGVIGDAVHAWVLTENGLVHRRLETSARELDASVYELWTTLQLGAEGERARLIDLHKRLIAPLRDAVANRQRLVVVPDGSIFNVPVAALVDGTTGRYLIEDVNVFVSPSLTLAPLRAEARVAEAPLRSVGIFGGNVPDRPFLAEIDAEHAAVERIYSSTIVTRRYRGDKREFLGNVGRHDIVHFAGHAVANLSDPAFSRLEFLRPDSLPTGDVLAQEIIGLDLNRVRVIVLGACRTGWGANVAGEGMLSLSHAFLGAGAHSVLGSLWDVDDRATRMLLTALHEEMARGRTLAEAVRTAQLRALSSADPSLRRPAGWAGFVATVRG